MKRRFSNGKKGFLKKDRKRRGKKVKRIGKLIFCLFFLETKSSGELTSECGYTAVFLEKETFVEKCLEHLTSFLLFQ